MSTKICILHIKKHENFSEMLWKLVRRVQKKWVLVAGKTEK